MAQIHMNPNTTCFAVRGPVGRTEQGKQTLLIDIPLKPFCHVTSVILMI